MVHSVSGWTRGVQVKLWDPLRTRAIPEHLRGVITTRRYTNPRLPLPLPLPSQVVHTLVSRHQAVQFVTSVKTDEVMTGCVRARCKLTAGSEPWNKDECCTSRVKWPISGHKFLSVQFARFVLELTKCTVAILDKERFTCCRAGRYSWQLEPLRRRASTVPWPRSSTQYQANTSDVVGFRVSPVSPVTHDLPHNSGTYVASCVAHV